MDKEEEVKAINIQLGALVFSLISVIISIILTYNQKLEAKGEKTLFSANKTLNITAFNRILILILSIIFLYVNYKLYKISKKEGEDLKPYILQILASVLTIITDIIVLYVVTLSSNEEVVDIENPII